MRHGQGDRLRHPRAFKYSSRQIVTRSRPFRRVRRADPSHPKPDTLSPKFTLSVECRLASSHILPGCPPCDRLHGHTWTVRAFWSFAELDENGMGANFRDLKQVLRSEVHDRYDHRHLNELAPFDRVAPTAENLAREVFRILHERMGPGRGGRLTRVEVWEGPEACAAYEE